MKRKEEMELAIARGDKSFISSNPCRKCGCTTFYIKGSACRCHDCLKRYKRDSYKGYTSDRRLFNFKLTKESYQTMLESQGNCCAICGDPFTETPHIDHCHTTGKVRGLLCRSCNLGLGRFKDNVQSLENAIKYLKA